MENKAIWVTTFDKGSTGEPLGPWCFNHRNDFDSFSSFKYGWSFTPHSFDKVEEESIALKDSLFLHIMERLNKQMKKPKGEGFWRTVLEPFLILFAQKYTLQKHVIDSIEEQYKEIEITFHMDFKEYPVSPKSYMEYFNNYVMEKNYTEWIFLHLLKAKKKSQWKIKEGELKSVFQYSYQPQSFVTKLKKWIDFAFLRINGVYGIGKKEAYSLGKEIPAKVESTLPRIEEIRKKRNIDKSIVELCWDSLPKEIKSIPLSRLPYVPFISKSRLRIVGPVMYDDEFMQLLVGLARDKGETIIPVQHGGNYSLLRNYDYVSEIEYSYPYFITWGWEGYKTSQCHFLPLPSPQVLNEKLDNASADESRLIFISNRYPTFPYRVWNFSVMDFAIEHFQEKVGFLKGLSRDELNRLDYRPYPTEHGALREGDYLRSELPDLKVYKGSGLKQKINNAKLVILDHPGTTLNYLLAKRVPFVLFFNEKLFRPSPESESFYKDLERESLWFQDKESLLRHVKSGRFSLPSEEFYTKYENLYSRNNNNWKQDWIQALRNLN